MSKEFEQLDNAQLLPKLKEWLESSPLYTEHRYTGGSERCLSTYFQVCVLL